MLDALLKVSPTIGTKKYTQYIVVRNRTVTAFNGACVVTEPIASDLDFACKGKPLIRALKKAKGASFALWVDGEKLMVKTEAGIEAVDCLPLSLFPDPLPGFWSAPPKPKKPEKPKAQPPERTWERPDYLPGLREALAWTPDLMGPADLVAACNGREPMILDCEVYSNYFLCAVTSFATGKVCYFEKTFSHETGTEEIYNSVTDGVDFDTLLWILQRFLVVTFNGNYYDLPMLALALAGRTCAQIKIASDKIIVEEIKPWLVLRSERVKGLKFVNHIDLVEVLPLDASLKIYGGRLHVPKMQDLPFAPNTVLSWEQITILRYYCINDLTGTAFAFANLREQIKIREDMTALYGIDLRSKSDAQVAEAVIKSEFQRLTYSEAHRPEIPPGTKYKYNKPDFIQFATPYMQRVLAEVLSWEFWVDDNGDVRLPIDPSKPLKEGKPQCVSLSATIANAVYTIGIGGLHSNESQACHKADLQFSIIDRDVTSYYPSIILNLGLYPSHLGPLFLQLYRSLVERRITAKKAAKAASEWAKTCLAGDNLKAYEEAREEEAKQKALAEMLKIVINGSFGKLGSKWSALYAPDLLMTVTITGQLSLLMLIEAMELSGFPVLSANTDGIIMKVENSRRAQFDTIIKGWENLTRFGTEETQYSALYSRDVNNYIAVKLDGKTKTKGAFFDPWETNETRYERFKKNPTGNIAVKAVIKYLTCGKPIWETVRGETDLRQFLHVRTVRGGGVKATPEGNCYLGKAVRWYHAKGEEGCIIYALSGNKVAGSDGARPCMDLPDAFPADLDFEHYEKEAESILEDLGFTVQSRT